MIHIEIWSDINCPFCYIGKRHLEKALGMHPSNVRVEWKSFELDPHANPPAGADNTELLAKKYGKDLAWAVAMNENMTQMAAEAGLEFYMEKVIAANSFNAHRLLHLSKKYNLQNEMKETLLAAKFTEGKDIGNIAVLNDLALSLGIKQEDIIELFETDHFTEEVRKDEEQAQLLGIRGVPFFVFNKEIAISGAQPVEKFIQVLTKLAHLDGIDLQP